MTVLKHLEYLYLELFYLAITHLILWVVSLSWFSRIQNEKWIRVHIVLEVSFNIFIYGVHCNEEYNVD